MALRILKFGLPLIAMVFFVLYCLGTRVQAVQIAAETLVFFKDGLFEKPLKSGEVFDPEKTPICLTASADDVRNEPQWVLDDVLIGFPLKKGRALKKEDSTPLFLINASEFYRTAGGVLDRDVLNDRLRRLKLDPSNFPTTCEAWEKAFEQQRSLSGH